MGPNQDFPLNLIAKQPAKKQPLLQNLPAGRTPPLHVSRLNKMSIPTPRFDAAKARSGAAIMDLCESLEQELHTMTEDYKTANEAAVLCNHEYSKMRDRAVAAEARLEDAHKYDRFLALVSQGEITSDMQDAMDQGDENKLDQLLVPLIHAPIGKR